MEQTHISIEQSDPYAAEDLVQVTLMKALPVLNGVAFHANLPALLRRIARNAWIDHVLKHTKDHLYNPYDLSMVGPNVFVEDSASVEEALALVLEWLTPQQRAVVLLCDVFQYTDREASVVLGIGRGAIKATLYRARLRLRTAAATNEHSAVADEAQKEILSAYVTAFQAADIRMLIHLCQSGPLDPVLATGNVFTLANQRSHVKSKSNANQRAMRVAA